MVDFDRKIATRLACGIAIELRLNEKLWEIAGGAGDATDLTNLTGRIYPGYPAGDETGKMIVQPFQINVAARRLSFVPGAGGTRDNDYEVSIGCFDHYRTEAYGFSEWQWTDVLETIKNWLNKGGSDNNGTGMILDPDRPVDPNPVEKYIVTNIAEWEYGTPPVTLPSKVASYYSLVGVMQTRENNTTGDRE